MFQMYMYVSTIVSWLWSYCLVLVLWTTQLIPSLFLVFVLQGRVVLHVHMLLSNVFVVHVALIGYKLHTWLNLNKYTADYTLLHYTVYCRAILGKYCSLYTTYMYMLLISFYPT